MMPEETGRMMPEETGKMMPEETGKWRTYLNNDKKCDKPIYRGCATKRLEDTIDRIPGSKKNYIKRWKTAR